MVSFNPEEIKNNLMNSIRTYLYPQQLDHSNSISLLDNSGTLIQSFYPFSSTITTIGVYIISKTGSPSGLTLDIKSGSSTIKTGTIPSTIGWNYLEVDTGDIITIRQSSLVVKGSVSSGNDYQIGASSIESYYFGSCGTINLAFTIGVQDYIYKVFPIEKIESDQLPVVVIDIFGRPRIDDKYLTGDFIWYSVNLRAEVYSKYTHELDKLIYGCDRGILKIRKNFPNIYYITPGQLSEISYIKPEVFSRNITWTFKLLVSRE